MKYTTLEITLMIVMSSIGMAIGGVYYGVAFAVPLTAFFYFAYDTYTFWEAIKESVIYAFWIGVFWNLGWKLHEHGLKGFKKKYDEVIIKTREKRGII